MVTKTKTKQANVGEVIQAKEFAFGYYQGRLNAEGHLVPLLEKVTVDGKTKKYPMQYTRPGTPWDKPREYCTIDLTAYEPARGRALFVVEKAEMNGGQTGTMFNHYEDYPNGWYVEARRLNPDRTYNPQGEVIRFYQSGFFTYKVEEVNVLDKMQLNFKKGEKK